MTPDDFLRRLAAVRTHKRRDERAPHKPLLLLLALGRVARHQERLVPYEEVEPLLRELMQSFGSPKSAVRPQYPFRWLRTDQLWDVPRFRELSRNASGDFYVWQLRELGIEGGLPEDAYDVLRADTGLLWQAVGEILREHFPESLHREIRDAAGIPEDGIAWEADVEEALPTPAVRERENGPPTVYSFLTRRRRRDPLFRKRVLDAYEERCSVCDLDIRLGDQLLGVEAAHIQWHSHGGPDQMANGLALCLLHHKALDRGALGLEERKGTGFNVLISREVRGERTGSLVDFSGRRIRPPRTRAMAPGEKFVGWHRREVFRSQPSTPT